MDETSVLETILELAKDNPVLAAVAGGVVGLAIVGAFVDDDEGESLSEHFEFENVDDEIAFHEKKLKLLREARRAKVAIEDKSDDVSKRLAVLEDLIFQLVEANKE